MLNEETNIAVRSKIQKHGCTAVFDIADEIAFGKIEKIHCHLAGDEFDFGLKAKIA